MSLEQTDFVRCEFPLLREPHESLVFAEYVLHRAGGGASSQECRLCVVEVSCPHERLYALAHTWVARDSRGLG